MSTQYSLIREGTLGYKCWSYRELTVYSNKFTCILKRQVWEKLDLSTNNYNYNYNNNKTRIKRKKKNTLLPIVVMLVGCFWLNGPLRQYFSLYQAVSQREGERNDRQEKKFPSPTLIQISKTPALEIYPAPSHHPTTPVIMKALACVSTISFRISEKVS